MVHYSPAISAQQYTVMKRNGELDDLYHCHTCIDRERQLNTMYEETTAAAGNFFF